jgi:hypothetical protein
MTKNSSIHKQKNPIPSMDKFNKKDKRKKSTVDISFFDEGRSGIYDCINNLSIIKQYRCNG